MNRKKWCEQVAKLTAISVAAVADDRCMTLQDVIEDVKMRIEDDLQLQVSRSPQSWMARIGESYGQACTCIRE